MSFFYITSNKMPIQRYKFGKQIIDMIDPNAKLPEIYSNELIDFIKDLLKSDPNERPSTNKAYYISIANYTILYLKITSIISSLECILAFNPIRDYFKSDIFKNYIKEDGNEHSFSNYVSEALDFSSFNSSDISELKSIGFQLRNYFNILKVNNIKSLEIDVFDFLDNLLKNIHSVLKKKDKDSLNEESIISKEIKFFQKKNIKCFACGSLVKNFISPEIFVSLSPDKASEYLNKKEIDIIDLLINLYDIK